MQRVRTIGPISHPRVKLHPLTGWHLTTARVYPAPRSHAEHMPGKGTPMKSFRLADGLWERFGAHAKAAGTTRPALLKAFILWWLDYPGAELPERPAQDPSGIDSSSNSTATDS